MKRTTGILSLIAVVVIAGFTIAPVSFSVDVAHSSIGFKVRHLGISNVRGNFADYEANVTVDPEDLSTLQASATIQIASIDTGIERRDGHLRSADFFDAETHPTMVFQSTSVQNIDGTTFELVGDLTIRGTTKEVVLEAELLGMARMGDSERIAFEAETTIDRFDYGLQWDRLTEAGGLVAGSEITITLDLEAIAQ